MALSRTRKSPRKSTRKSNRKSSRRASATRGWKAPKTLSARRAMKAKCGSRCFLMPKELKFPICTRDCKVSSRGVVSANVRAAQWKYPKVEAKASRMIKKGKMTKASRKTSRKGQRKGKTSRSRR